MRETDIRSVYKHIGKPICDVGTFKMDDNYYSKEQYYMIDNGEFKMFSAKDMRAIYSTSNPSFLEEYWIESFEDFCIFNEMEIIKVMDILVDDCVEILKRKWGKDIY